MHISLSQRLIAKFIQLKDTPAAYAGQVGKFLRVNAVPDAIEFVTFPDHAHAGVAGDGAKLDWDDVWSDAAHDHSSAAEGGQLIDLNGAADALVLDADGDTSISAPTDDQIDIEIGGTDEAAWTAIGLKQAANRDIYPDNDGRGIFRRGINRHSSGYNWHFRTGDPGPPTGYAWQAAPFVPVAAIYYAFSNDYMIAALGGAGQRAFMSIPITNAAAAWQHKGLGARIRTGDTTQVGARIDDGTDNNYAEILMTGVAADGTQRLIFVWRQAAGAVNTITSNLILPVDTFISVWLYLLYAAPNYTAIGYVLTEDGLSSGIAGFNHGFGAGVFPAAGRGGVIYKDAGAWASVDWIYKNFG